MLRTALQIVVLFGAALFARPVAARSDIQLKSPNVDFPSSDLVFPPGPGSEAINNNCVTCHSVDHVMNQPLLSKEAWEEVVHKMVNSYKAPVSDVDAAQIVDYLARVKGKS